MVNLSRSNVVSNGESLSLMCVAEILYTQTQIFFRVTYVGKL